MPKYGDCTMVAGHMIMDVPKMLESETRLCHGTAWSEYLNRWIRHAWIELADSIVFDNANGKKHTLLKRDYYRIGKIKDVKRYTKEEALKLMLKTKHFGWWDE